MYDMKWIWFVHIVQGTWMYIGEDNWNIRAVHPLSEMLYILIRMLLSGALLRVTHAVTHVPKLIFSFSEL